MPRAFRPAPALAAARSRARRRDEHGASASPIRRPFCCPAEDGARSSDRSRVRPRGSAPDLSGVAHGLPSRRQRRLVVDIGGGSTEFIIGQGFDALETESCRWAASRARCAFFGDGKITPKRWRQAQTEIAVELQQFAADYRARGWGERSDRPAPPRRSATSCRRTAGATRHQRERAGRLRDALLEAGSLDNLRLAGLTEDRVPVIAGGVAILEAAFATFAVEQMSVCETAMREGLLYDMVGRAMHGDPRSGSIAALALRYGVDRAQAARVHHAAMVLFDQVADDWQLGALDRDLLGWCRGHPRDRACDRAQPASSARRYIVANSDLAGSAGRDNRRWLRSSARIGANPTATASMRCRSGCAARRVA
jgi:exopolyphosphatase/guanosine-5'-triphosphate,3'-diphosphate pyrophosphatase